LSLPDEDYDNFKRVVRTKLDIYVLLTIFPKAT